MTWHSTRCEYGPFQLTCFDAICWRISPRFPCWNLPASSLHAAICWCPSTSSSCCGLPVSSPCALVCWCLPSSNSCCDFLIWPVYFVLTLNHMLDHKSTSALGDDKRVLFGLPCVIFCWHGLSSLMFPLLEFCLLNWWLEQPYVSIAWALLARLTTWTALCSHCLSYIYYIHEWSPNCSLDWWLWRPCVHIE